MKGCSIKVVMAIPPGGEIMTLNEEIQASMKIINECCREVLKLAAELRDILGARNENSK